MAHNYKIQNKVIKKYIYIKFNIKVHIITEFTATMMNMRSIIDFFICTSFHSPQADRHPSQGEEEEQGRDSRSRSKKSELELFFSWI